VDGLEGLNNVDTIQSESTSGASLVLVQFKDGTDLNTSRQDLQAAVDKVRAELPTTAQNSSIQAFSTSQLPILVYAISANEPLGDLATQLDTDALPKLKGIAGVSSVSLTGAPIQEVQVVLDPAKLAAIGVTISEVSVAIGQSDVVMSVGTVQKDGATIPVEVFGSVTSVDQIGAIAVTAAKGSPTGPQAAGLVVTSPALIRDLGSVALVSVPADTITRTNGRISIGLQILKAPNANTVQVAAAVRAALPDIETRVAHGVKIASIEDQATPITDAIGSILQEGLLGALFAVIVIFGFLRSWRATVVAAVSIPLSLMVVLLVLWSQGITLNILTLGGMMVAIGRVVDDAIVVLENISRHVSEGEKPLPAAYTGAREILTAVTASTLTTVAVFAPIAFLTGIAGDFFRPFAVTVVAALLASLLVAVTVVPLLASRLLPARRSDSQPTREPGAILQGIYVPVVRWATGHRALSLIAAVAFFVGSIGLALHPGLRVNLLDQSSSRSFPITVTMPLNSTLAETDTQTQWVEAGIRGLDGVTGYQATVGQAADPFAPPGSVPADPTLAKIMVLVRKGSYDQVSANVQRVLNGYEGQAKIEIGVGQSSSNSSSSALQVEVDATDPSTLAAASDKTLGALRKVAGIVDLQSNLAGSKPEFLLQPTPLLAQSGLTPQTLGGLVAEDINGQVAATATLASGPVKVRVELPPLLTTSPDALASLQIPTATGVVPLSALANLVATTGPQTINRTGSDRTATITGNITSNDTRAVGQAVDKALKGLSLPGGATASASGATQELASLLNQFILALLAAIALVYLIMVATFRSLIKPLVLLVSIPFAASGAIVALVVTQTSLSLPGLIGLLMLTGIVVTNAIVLLDLVEQYRDRGLDLPQALIEGGRHRLRPILMTAFATMLALIPLAFSGTANGGGFIGAPLAIVVIGGLFTSTLLTLILVPVLYSLVAP
jgi:HAE1 family hydrophobic/amphiphilic exporter-1